MAILTNFLNLFKYDLEKDKKSTFNFKLSLNDNWDKIDKWAENINKEQSSLNASIPTLLTQLKNDAGFITAATVALNSLYTTITASGNDFCIEFFNDSAKTNRVFMIQLGIATGFTTVTFKKKFNSLYGVFAQVITSESCVSAAISSVTVSSFYVNDGTHGGRHEDRGGLSNYWVAFGK